MRRFQTGLRLLGVCSLLTLFAACSELAPAPEYLPDILNPQACSPVLSMVDTVKLLKANGRIPQAQWATAGAIAKAESGLCVNAVNTSNSNGTVDRGLYQINSVHGYSSTCLFNATCNTDKAATIYLQRGNWTAWSTYNAGLHTRFLDEARAAVATVTGGSTTCTRSWPTVKRNTSYSSNAKVVQYLLRARGYSVVVDGYFGSATESTVKSFQSSKGLVVDGSVGKQTWEKLALTVQYGSQGDAVRAAQGKLGVTVDGNFGSVTKTAAINFQKSKSLLADGIVGLNTWASLVGGQGCR